MRKIVIQLAIAFVVIISILVIILTNFTDGPEYPEIASYCGSVDTLIEAVVFLDERGAAFSYFSSSGEYIYERWNSDGQLEYRYRVNTIYPCRGE